MKLEYYYTTNGKRKGPVNLGELKRLALDGDLRRSDKVWTENMPDWQRADSVEGIFQDLPPDLPSEGIPREEPPALPTNGKQKRIPKRKELKQARLVGFSILIAGLIVFACVISGAPSPKSAAAGKAKALADMRSEFNGPAMRRAGFQKDTINRALTQGGTVVAWGDNDNGQCNVPTGLRSVVAIAAGGGHTVALKQDRTVVAWGCNDHGESTVPTGLADVVAIAAGGFHTVALVQGGTVVAWGDNGKGQCDVPTGLSDVVAIAAGGRHTVALKQDGTVVAWGSNGESESIVPSSLSGVVAIAAGGRHTVALKLNYNANINAKPPHGETPLNMAEQFERTDVAEFRRQHSGQEPKSANGTVPESSSIQREIAQPIPKTQRSKVAFEVTIQVV